MSEPTKIQALAEEVAGSNFKDPKLRRRLRSLVSSLAANPGVSLPRAFDSAGLEGAYRFLSNPRVTPDKILASHLRATRDRCESEGDFLVIHDSTKFSYRFDGEREGLGRARLGNLQSKQVFFAHVSLAVAADGTRRPLGVAAFKTWARATSRTGVEHLRWEEQLRISSECLGGLKKAIHLMDREADDYAMLASLEKDGHRFVVRCQYNRLLPKTSAWPKLFDAFATLECTVSRKAELSRRKPSRNPVVAEIHPRRAHRTANLNISAATITFALPKSRRQYRTLPPPLLAINVVRVWEPDPPADEEPIEWYLYTTEPIATAEQILTIVDHYRARWTIEEYFKAIKTGCDFERRQLQDFEALTNLLATFLPIAYRMLLIRNEARRTPNFDALAVLSQDHIDVLRIRGRVPLGPSPTVREIYLAVAALGGYIKYSKKDPGWLTLSRGLERLDALTEGWLLAKLHLHHSDQR